MKMKVYLIMFALLTGFFISCNDNKKSEQDNKEEMEQMEAERQAELQKEKEKMEMEANSIAAKAKETDTLSTLVNAMKSADLADMFTEEDGPFTVFAPTNAAFSEVDKATLDTLMKPSHKQELSDLLKYHVVEDKITSQDLVQMINDNDGEYTITTAGGGELTASMDGDSVILTDEAGNKAKIVQVDIDASNGVIHLIDAVVMKKS